MYSYLYFYATFDFLFPVSFFFSWPKITPPLPLELRAKKPEEEQQQCKQDLLLSFAVKLVVMEFWPFLRESVQRYGGFDCCCCLFAFCSFIGFFLREDLARTAYCVPGSYQEGLLVSPYS